MLYADGSKLPPILKFKRKTLPKEKLPGGVPVHVHPKGWTDKDGMKLCWRKCGTNVQVDYWTSQHCLYGIPLEHITLLQFREKCPDEDPISCYTWWANKSTPTTGYKYLSISPSSSSCVRNGANRCWWWTMKWLLLEEVRDLAFQLCVSG